MAFIQFADFCGFIYLVSQLRTFHIWNNLHWWYILFWGKGRPLSQFLWDLCHARLPWVPPEASSANRDPSTASLASWVKGRSRPTRACDDGGICFPYSNELRVGSWQGIYRACVSTGHTSSCLEEISRFHFDIWRLPSIFFFTAQFQLVAT